MAWNTPGSDNSGGSNGRTPRRRPGGRGLDALLDPLRGIFGGGGGSGGILRWVGIVFALWLAFNCFVLVTEQERGVVLRFGQFSRVLQPGPHFKMPWPIERVTKVNATQSNAYSDTVPVFTRDVINSGLLCQHCGGTAVEFLDIPKVMRPALQNWADEYAGIHAVAHYDEAQMSTVGNYDEAFEKAASNAEHLLALLATRVLPGLLEYYPALIWEDQDECLEVEPKDIVTWT